MMVVCCQNMIRGTVYNNAPQKDNTPTLNNSLQSVSVTEKMISSGFGAMLTSIAVTPLDVVKTRLQAQEKIFSKQKCFIYYNGLWDHLCYCDEGTKMKPYPNGSQNCVWYKRPGHFNGTLDAFVKIPRNEGITSLWSGLPPTLLMAIPATILYFTIYDQSRESMCQLLKTPYAPVWVTCVAGACARVFTVSTVSPIELIRTKMQSENVKYSEVFSDISKMIKQMGIMSLYRGWAPTILRDVPFSIVYWGIYESVKQYSHSDHPSIFFSFVTGAGAGTVAALVTYPFDVVKTHRQVELGDLDALKNKGKSSTMGILVDLYKTRGMKVFYTGLMPRLIKITPSCAIMISCYEYGKTYFLSKRKHDSEVIS